MTQTATATDTTKRIAITYHTDPGHGWLAVPHDLIATLGLKPSSFSYRDAQFGYLEEDCDAGDFMEAVTKAGYAVQLKVENTEHDSFIRGLSRF